MASTSLQDKGSAPRYGTLPGANDGASPVRPIGPDSASLWSRLMFNFATPVMELGDQRQLNADDLWEATAINRAENAYPYFKSAYDRSNGSIGWAIVRAYGTRLLLFGSGTLLALASTLFAPIVLNHVVVAFTAQRVDVDDLALWLGVFFSTRLITTVISSQVSFYTFQTAIQLNAALRVMLFEKALRRQSKNKAEGKAADLSNLFTADMNNVLSAAFRINDVWTIPLQIGGVVYLLYKVVGVAAFAGLGVIFLSIIVGGYIASLSGQAFGQIMQRKDTRMKLVKEVFGAIQVVKLNAWDNKFTDKLLEVRENELEAVWRTLFLSAINSFVLWGSPLLVSISTFGVYTLVMHQPLTAAKVFTSMALFASIRSPLTILPQVLGLCIQAAIALGRMQEYLALPEVDTTLVDRNASAYPADVAIDIKNGSFGWTNDTPLLKNINITAKKGDFVVVHGIVGSGKSSLCSALLGEMDKIDGTVFVRGRVAYYSQQTWIQNMTIRENVLFGNAYDEKKYQRVLDACGLLPDLGLFPAGDSTEIGQKGINLSGGQKARLCLARACYSDADVLILDSPLAAVDAVVQSEIFSKCLCTLLEEKTVVLVTHAPDIIASDAVNLKLEVVDGEVTSVRRTPAKRRSAYAAKQSPSLKSASQAITPDSEDGRLISDEDRESGRVSNDVYRKYFDALGGVRTCFILVVVLISWQASQISSDLWLSKWTGQKSGVYDESATEYNMAVYAGLCMVSAFLVLARSMTGALVGIRAARYLFEKMTRALLRAPLRFFDATPIGRIINRYGDDMGAVDFILPMCTIGVITILVFIIGQLGTAIVTVKVLGVLVLPLVYAYVKTTSFYLGPSREVSRLVKVSDSPVLSYVAGSEEGVATIRAFGPEYVRRAREQVIELTNANSQAYFADSVISEWFQLRIQLVGCGVIIVIVSALVYLHEVLSPGTVGLAFTYTLNIQMQLLQLVGIWAFLENTMVSPERILEYASVAAEGESRLLQIEPTTEWPTKGTVDFDNVVFSYKPGAPAVLKGLSFSIKNNEKIGIVGRTGAGKSSLTMALFRINELDSGRVLIDGKDIASMPLKSLRSKLSIIPQAPVLFKGPLRGYMDPFEEYSDAEIWEAFEKVEMKEQISALEGQLAYELTENGENFSVGERQMLCMARAMLTKARIVVMDEATASIDHETEKKLQHMINRDFQNATVLTIAHRLATVLDSDRIMVLSEGRVVEFDTPRNLVKDKKGTFYELAKEGGVLDKLLGGKK